MFVDYRDEIYIHGPVRIYRDRVEFSEHNWQTYQKLYAEIYF